MTAETDLLLDRRRLKGRLVRWQVIGVLALLGCVLLAIGRFAPTGQFATNGQLASISLERPYVARVNITGLITDDRRRIEGIQRLADDASVRAVIVSIDSPGGGAAAGEALHDALAGVAKVKPVVTVMGTTAASAGYMVAVPAARIFARDATLTGSIGVLLQTAEFSGLLSTIGVTSDTLASGPLKDQPNPAHPLSAQGREVLQGLVMDIYDQFVGIVAAGRHMTPDAVRALADGRAYTGRQALKLGLIDEIGGEREARAWLAAERQVPESLPVHTVRRPGGFLTRAMADNVIAPLGDMLKTLFSQHLMLDGMMEVWQPRAMGE